MRETFTLAAGWLCACYGIIHSFIMLACTTGRRSTAFALGANPVRVNIWSRRSPQSVITTHRDLYDIGPALLDLFWALLAF